MALSVLLFLVLVMSETFIDFFDASFLGCTQKSITSDDYAYLFQFENDWWYSDTPCIWCSFWSSFNNLGTIFVQTFCMPKSLVIIFQIRSFFISSWLQLFIQSTNDHHKPPALAAQHDLSRVCWRPLTPAVFFHLLAPLFKRLVPLKNRCVYSVISIYLLKHFKCLWWNFFLLD